MHAVATAVAVLAALHTTCAAGLYTKNSAVMQVDAKSYDRLISHSNHTAIVEFYAPWCGHCQNLKPAYEKAARHLDGLGHVAAVDCDDAANKQFCGRMGIQGFPTLKIVRPGKKPGRPVVQDYQGPRTATGIVEAVVGNMNNHVTKVTDAEVNAFLEANPDTPKALLFTDKGTVTPLLKSIAIDFLGALSVGQVRNKEAQTVARFGISSFPTLVLLPGGGTDAIVYGGELKKDAIVKFLSQAAAPNPYPAPSASSSDKKKRDEKTKKETLEKKEKKDKKATSEDDATATTSTPTEQQTAPVIVDVALPIPTIHSREKLDKECLSDKAHTCLLAFVPPVTGEASESAEAKKHQAVLDSLSEIAYKYAHSKRRLFGIHAVPVGDEMASLLTALHLDESHGDSVQLVALNARRGWWKHYGGPMEDEAIETWVDSIRMGEGERKDLPAGLVVRSEEESAEPSKSTSSMEAQPTESETESANAAPEATGVPAADTDEIKHEEL